MTGVVWGRVADRYGRKTVLILGSLGTIISCIGFGLSKSFIVALFFRFLGGFVNGNIAVIRTMVSEVIKEKKYQSRAFLLMPMCYNVGAVFGPALGGLLADPAGTYPSVFGDVKWMKRWPYLLPNLASALTVFLSLITVVFSLDETLADGMDRRDYGRIFSTKILRVLRIRSTRVDGDIAYHQVPSSEPQTPLSAQIQSPRQDEESKVGLSPVKAPKKAPMTKLPFRRIWTANVLFTLLAHFATAFHLGTFNSLWFIFLSADRSPEVDQTSFTGGLALRPQLVGLAMSILGFIGITLQVLIYPKVNDKYGVLPPYRLFVLCFPIAYALAPFLVLVPSTTSPPEPASGAAVWIAICLVLCLFVVGRTFRPTCDNDPGQQLHAGPERTGHNPRCCGERGLTGPNAWPCGRWTIVRSGAGHPVRRVDLVGVSGNGCLCRVDQSLGSHRLRSAEILTRTSRFYQPIHHRCLMETSERRA